MSFGSRKIDSFSELRENEHSAFKVSRIIEKRKKVPPALELRIINISAMPEPCFIDADVTLKFAREFVQKIVSAARECGDPLVPWGVCLTPNEKIAGRTRVMFFPYMNLREYDFSEYKGELSFWGTPVMKDDKCLNEEIMDELKDLLRFLPIFDRKLKEGIGFRCMLPRDILDLPRYKSANQKQEVKSVRKDGYTEGVSNSQRYKAIGNGWTVDVIAHILGFLPKDCGRKRKIS